MKLRQPKGWESFVANYTKLESAETDEYTVTIDPDEDAIFQLLDEMDGLYQYALVQFGDPESDGGDDGSQGWEIADSVLSGSWQDEISQRASLEVVMYENGIYNMGVRWGNGANETAVWEVRGYFAADENDNTTLTYDDGLYYMVTLRENGNENNSQVTTTQGKFTLEQDGKLRWEDSQVAKNGYSEGCLFVQMGE